MHKINDYVQMNSYNPFTAHDTGQTGSGNEAIMLHKYEQIQHGKVFIAT
jgi:hypothetical protein